MSSFGARRKARVIKVDDDEDIISDNGADSGDGASKSGSCQHSKLTSSLIKNKTNNFTTLEDSKPSFTSKTAKKPLRQSGLRKAFNVGDQDTTATGNQSLAGQDDDDEDGPVVIRPMASRSGIKQKKKAPKSRLSFGGDNPEDDDDESSTPSTPKTASLGQRALENSAVKRSIGKRGIPMRLVEEEEDSRPKYSKEYLDELQSSTPTTPRDTPAVQTPDDDEMDLDPSELEGALIVESAAEISAPVAVPVTRILSDAEIKERKARRARLALEQGVLSVESDDNDDDDDEEEMGSRKKKDDTRLKADDENMGEGFDEYVEDGGLSLGKRAEKERRKRDRQKMAELITAAEGNTSDSSSDSDAERRIAYESAQTRAGMDGMKRPLHKPSEDMLQIPPKITPLPSLAECVTDLQSAVRSMQQQLQIKRGAITQLQSERDSIARREIEVQTLLDETGKKYQEATGQGPIILAIADGDAPVTALAAVHLAEGRGLESLGTTPSRGAVDSDGDESM